MSKQTPKQPAAGRRVEPLVRTICGTALSEAGWERPNEFRKTINGVACCIRPNRNATEWWFQWKFDGHFRAWPRPMTAMDHVEAIEKLLHSF